MSQSWESLQANNLYKDLIEFKDVFPYSVSCELPKDKGTRHEIDLKPGSKYCVMKQWPLPREQVLSIGKFVADRLAAGHVREGNLLRHIALRPSVYERPQEGGV